MPSTQKGSIGGFAANALFLVTLNAVKGLTDSSVIEFTLSEARFFALLRMTRSEGLRMTKSEGFRVLYVEPKKWRQ